MKKILITYNISEFDELGWIERETYTEITVTDTIARVLVEDDHLPESLLTHVETALKNLEFLKGRQYVNGSIKGFEY